MKTRQRLRRQLTLGLIASLVLWTIQPGVSTAQLRTEVRTEAEQTGSAPGRQPKRDLKAAFTSEIGALKSASVTKAELSRIQTASQTATSSGKFGKRQKIFLALWIICMTGLVIVLIKHPCKAKDPKDCEPIDDSYSY